MKKKQLVILNSGGLDSVCMIHHLMERDYLGSESLSVFFNYGQRNMEFERECARNIAYTYSIKHIEVDLPPMPWCSSSLFNGKSTNQYIEMRNLIFLSYATSIAQSIKAKTIAMAVLEGSTYDGTKPEFIERFNAITNDIGIELITPFDNTTKTNFWDIMRRHNITRYDYFSCNEPNEYGEPCNECLDCLTIKELEESVNVNESPAESWIMNGCKYTKEYEDLYWNNKITEMRLLINNSCQFNCSHCFYGFEDMQGKLMTDDQFKETIDKAFKFGVENIHFSGKEPLLNKKIFKYIKHIDDNYLGEMTCDIVTNGVNVIKFIDDLKACKSLRKIYLSVDNLGDTKVRPNSDNVLGTISALNEAGIPVQVFIDVHKDNYKEVHHILDTLKTEYKVNEFHIRDIMPIGNGKQMKDKIVTYQEMSEVLENLLTLDLEGTNIEFKISKRLFLDTENQDWCELKYHVDYYKDTFNMMITENIQLIPQINCHKYTNQFTVTPDGYVLGCGSEMSSANYHTLSHGNVKEEDILPIIKRSREAHLQVNKDLCSLNKYITCYHEIF